MRPPDSTGPAPSRVRLPDWTGPVLLAAFFAGLTAWSWEKWADVHIDFGAELYAAWRLAEGDALYRDIAYRHGPLPHHLNALWFTLFGVSIRTLVLCNLAVLGAIAALQWGIFRRACGPWTASAVTAVMLGVFAFGQYVPIGNYNFVTPYHHHQSHGLALALAMIAAFGAAWRRPARGVAWHAAAGLCLGGAFLTKAELFVPAAVAAALGLGVTCMAAPDGRRARLAAFAAGLLLPPLAFFATLALRMPAWLAGSGVLGNWTQLGSGLLAEPFYRRGAGLDDPLGNGLRVAAAAAALAGFAGLALAVDRAVPPGRSRAWIAGGAGALVFAALTLGSGGAPWLDRGAWYSLALALPLTTAAGLALLLRDLWRVRASGGVLASRAPLVLYAVLALGLLGKMLLRARFDHYGFALALPATLLLVAGLLELGPRVLGAGRGGIARAVVTGAVAAGVVFFLGQSHEFYRRKDFAVGEGVDRIVATSPYTSPRPARLAETLERLDALMPASATLLVLPEGASINYWLRRRNPSGHLLFLPPEIAFFGESAMLARLEAHPPDFVALVHRLAQEFGTGPFGVDPRYGRALLAWVDRHYERVVRIGDEPFRDGFGVVVLERREARQAGNR